MKNKVILKEMILCSIVVLLGIVIWYTVCNRDKISSLKNTVAKDSSFEDLDDMENRRDENASPVYKSDNRREDYGIKNISSLEDFEKAIGRSTNTFLVLGQTGCHYCDLYKPVLEEVANLYEIEVLYVDIKALTAEDSKGVFNSSLTIPAKCAKSGIESSLADGFGTPLSLFVRNRSSYDCIRGYRDKDNLTSTLKSIGYIN